MCALPPAPALPYFEDKQNKDFMFTTPLYLGSLGFETEGSTTKRSCADRNMTEWQTIRSLTSTGSCVQG